MLKSVKNLRSQVCRAAIQAVQVVFLNIGQTLATDSDSLIKQLLQKSSDTNKFIRYMISLSCVLITSLFEEYDCEWILFRSDSKKALDLMAENFSVYKVISLVITGFHAQKNVVIRSNSADIVDSVITRYQANIICWSWRISRREKQFLALKRYIYRRQRQLWSGYVTFFVCCYLFKKKRKSS